MNASHEVSASERPLPAPYAACATWPARAGPCDRRDSSSGAAPARSPDRGATASIIRGCAGQSLPGLIIEVRRLVPAVALKSPLQSRIHGPSMHVDRRSVLETILICRPFLLSRRDALFSVANGREVRKYRAQHYSRSSFVNVARPGNSAATPGRPSGDHPDSALGRRRV